MQVARRIHNLFSGRSKIVVVLRFPARQNGVALWETWQLTESKETRKDRTESTEAETVMVPHLRESDYRLLVRVAEKCKLSARALLRQALQLYERRFDGTVNGAADAKQARAKGAKEFHAGLPFEEKKKRARAAAAARWENPKK